MKRIILNFGLFLICLITTTFLFINFISDILYRFMNVGTILYLSLLFFTSYTLFAFLHFIIYKNINNKLLDILAITYLIAVLGLTFDKGEYRSINLNPFTLIDDFKDYFHHTFLLLVSNIIIYFPLGIYSKYKFNIKSRIQVVGFLIYIVLIEFTQYLLHLGILDINDILTNTLGFVGGILLYQIIINKSKNQINTNS